MRLLVTGASGLLGLNLSLVAAAQGHQVFGLIHQQGLRGVPFDLLPVDLLEMAGAMATIEKTQPEAIINCAAIADLNVAEKEPELARQLNRDAAGQLADAASRWGIPMIHISTDAVFDGVSGGYDEASPPNPLSVYAQTKLEGEQVVCDRNPDAIIARVVFFGWSMPGNRSLAEFFFNNLREGRQVKGFTDTQFNPLYTEDLAEVLLEMLTAGLSGLYHVVSPEHLSKYDFGVRIAKRFGFDADLIEPIRMYEIARGAPRALNLVLKPDKVQAALGHPLPSVDAGIEQFYQRWQETYPQQLQSYAVQ
jgi:dTDP-4-dehydrorhamnose reductase